MDGGWDLKQGGGGGWRVGYEIRRWGGMGDPCFRHPQLCKFRNMPFGTYKTPDLQRIRTEKNSNQETLYLN